MPQQRLDYQSRPIARRLGRYSAAAIGVAVGVAVTVVGFVVHWVATGGGHGQHGWGFGYIMFPFVFLASDLTTAADRYTLPNMALLQFPVYGGVIGFLTRVSRRALAIALAVILVAHGLAVAAAWPSVQ